MPRRTSEKFGEFPDGAATHKHTTGSGSNPSSTRNIKLFCYIFTPVGFSNDGHAITINITGPIHIHTHSFSVSGGQLNAQDEEIAVDGLERPLNKTVYNYINNVCQRYLQQIRSLARDEPSS